MYYFSVHKLLSTTILFFTILQTCSTQTPMLLKRVRECLSKPAPILCLKEEALDVLNQTVMSDRPMQMFNLINIEKDPNYVPEITDNELPLEENDRSLKINSLLHNKVEEFFESRMIKFSLSNVIEGRKKKDRTSMMLMMGGLAMAGMMGQMFLGKIAFLAGSALLVAKMALMLSTVSALKKGGGGGGGGGGGESHIVYTTDSGSGHSGGWHRSLNSPESSPQHMAYSNYSPPDASNNVNNNNYGY